MRSQLEANCRLTPWESFGSRVILKPSLLLRYKRAELLYLQATQSLRSNLEGGLVAIQMEVSLKAFGVQVHHHPVKGTWVGYEQASLHAG